MRRRRRLPGLSVTAAGDQGGTRAACNAPFTSLYLDPVGDVRACCQNQWQTLGSVTESPLSQIWRGDRLARLRQHVGRGDLRLGCELCAVCIERGTPESAYLHAFDHLDATDAHPEWPQQLELALSNACNLQCVMCNGDLSSSIRAHREGRPALPEVYDDAFFADLDAFLPHLRSVIFLGGEPFLARESLRVMERLVELGLTPRCHVTTNGTRWNDRVAAILDALPVHVAISVDGATAATVEAIRVGVDHAELLANIDRFRRATGPGAGCSLTFCLMRSNWHELGALLRWADERDMDVIVNTVTHPPSSSLHHCPTHELREVVAALDREGAAERRSEGRNGPVWDAQLRSLAGLLAQRPSGGTDQGPSGDLAGPVHQHARRLAAHGRAPEEVGFIDAGADQVIQAVHPADGSPDLSPLVGRSLWQVPTVLGQHLGETVSSGLTFHGDGLEERLMAFDDGRGGRTRVTAVMVARPDGGQRWYLGVAPDAGR